jgi:protein pelota
MGAYHTIDLEMNRKFTLQKTEWDAIALERVETATNPARTADVAAVIMAEGLAQVCLITSSMTIVRQRVESTIPRKRKGSASLHDKVPPHVSRSPSCERHCSHCSHSSTTRLTFTTLCVFI